LELEKVKDLINNNDRSIFEIHDETKKILIQLSEISKQPDKNKEEIEYQSKYSFLIDCIENMKETGIEFKKEKRKIKSEMQHIACMIGKCHERIKCDRCGDWMCGWTKHTRCDDCLRDWDQ